MTVYIAREFRKFCDITNDCDMTKISNFYLQKATDKVDLEYFKHMSFIINLGST